MALDFTNPALWRRGDQPYGTLTTASTSAGATYGKLDYNIPGTAQQHFVVFDRVPAVTLAGQPQALTLWVYGDGSGNFLNVWVKDQAGQIRQFSFGRILHANSWKAMTAPLDTSAPWPQGNVSGPDSPNLSYPLTVYAVVLDAFPKAGATAYTGTIYFDQMLAGTDAGKGPATPPQ